MENYNKQKWEDLDLSRDEIKSIGEALKKEEFRTLLLDYVKEINDPENRKQYEQEITQLENERGVNVTFIHPSPGYVIKTSVNGKDKAFINICSNANIEKPSSTPSVDDKQKGLRWSIPHCIAPPRDDLDKKNNTCKVYDVVFHPDTLHLTKSNDSFKKLVDETALDAVESNFNVALDKINLKFPKMQFKGMKQASVIRKRIQNFQPSEVANIPNYPYPPLKDHYVSQKASEITFNTDKRSTNVPTYSTPKHVITYRNSLDMQNFTNDQMCKITATVPNELVITIDLPLLKRSTDACLDVLEKSLILISEFPAKYKLKLNLPYVVDSNKGTAKFDTDKKKLTVTLPVVKSKRMDIQKIDLCKDDSGIESDNIINEQSRVSSGSSSDEDSLEKGNTNQLKDFKSNTERFLKQNVHYSLPPFECLVPSFGILKLDLFVPNVEPSSVEYISLTKGELAGFHVSFLSTGNGFFTQHFAICFLLPSHRSIEDGTLTAEVWDTKVCIQAKFVDNENNCDSSFFVGVDECKVEKRELLKNSSRDLSKQVVSEEKELPRHFYSKKGKNPENWKEKESVSEEEKNRLLEYTEHAKCQNNILEDQAENKKFEVNKVEPCNHKYSDNNRHSSLMVSAESGSSFDDESSSSPPRQSGKARTQSESHQGNTSIKQRGILKIGRSLSESSADDYASWSTDRAEKSKKTVRFSDVISRQTFRLNSSILGQRKKNQKKMKNKKRAQERRLSESGNESEGENEVFHRREKTSLNNPTEMWSEEADTSSCDISEVSDISESDDGQQKDDPKTFIPCSSRKNHRRRGKKSARKQAATAKIQFFDH